MTARGRVGAWLVAFAALGSVFACVDLFHSTDFETLCDVDARALGCYSSEASTHDVVADVSDAGPTDFCTWSVETARRNAQRACAWLGACSAPFDENAFGQCMIKAILAYDCKTNPNLTIAPGPLHTYWDALWQAKSCIDVPNLNPDNVSCSGDGFACLPGKGVESVLLECDDKVTHAETCMLEGKVCGGLECVTPSAKKDCDPPSCEGSVLHACAEGGVDEGYDCQYFGLGACVDDGGAGCSPNTMNGFGSCAQGATVTCDAGVAVGCVAGTSETVVCDNLTGQGTCEGGTPNWNVAGACQGSGSCKPSCAGDTLTGCAQGATFTVNCKDVGLGPCREVALPATTTGYACASP